MGKKSFKIKIKVKKIKNGLTMENKETICEKRDCLNIGTELMNNRLFCKEHKNIMSNKETNKTAEEVAFELYPRVINDPYNPQEDDNKEYRDIWLSGVKFSASENQELVNRIEVLETLRDASAIIIKNRDAEIKKLREALRESYVIFITDGLIQSVIGVVSTLKKADEFIDDYYGQFKLINFRDIRDSGIEWEKEIEVTEPQQTYKVKITLLWFEVDAK